MTEGNSARERGGAGRLRGSHRIAWRVGAVVGAAALSVYWALPLVAQAVMFGTLTLLAAATMTVKAVRSVGPVRTAWWLVALGQLMYAAGDVVLSVTAVQTDSVPSASVSDVLFLASYPVTAAGLWTFARLRQVIRGWDAVIDMLIAGVAGALAIWMLLLPLFAAPGSSPDQDPLYLAYPVGDLVIIVLVARLAVAAGSRVRALLLLLLGYLLLISGDLLFAVVSVRTPYDPGGVTDMAWLYGYLCIILAASHPSASVLGTPAPAAGRSMLYRRIAFLLAAGVLPPILFLANTAIGEQPNAGFFAAGSALLYGLILTRLSLSVRWEEQELRRTGLPWTREH